MWPSPGTHVIHVTGGTALHLPWGLSSHFITVLGDLVTLGLCFWQTPELGCWGRARVPLALSPGGRRVVPEGRGDRRCRTARAGPARGSGPTGAGSDTRRRGHANDPRRAACRDTGVAVRGRCKLAPTAHRENEYRARYPCSRVMTVHSGCADPCDITNCGNLDCRIYGRGGWIHTFLEFVVCRESCNQG